MIHCLGPRYGIDQPEAELLADCYQNALGLAAERQVESVGFPAISTGAFGYPSEDAVPIAVGTVRRWLEVTKWPRKVCFVVYDAAMRELYQRELEDA